MASITFSGQLDQAMNEAAAEGNKILFIPQQTVGEVLPGAASELVVESDGSYSITLAYNTYSIYHYSDVTKKKTLIANSVVVSADTAVSTIPDLIGSTVPVTEDSVLTIQGYLTEAQDSAAAASESEDYISGVVESGHNALTGRDNEDAHPSSSITFGDSDVESELSEINDTLSSRGASIAQNLHTIAAKCANGEAVNFCAYGDSTTDGNNTTGWVANTADTNHNDDAPNAWPVKLQELLREVYANDNINVWNAGYSATRMDSGFAVNNYDDLVINNPYYGTPDVLFIGFGLNDIKESDFLDDHISQTKILIERVITEGTLPVLVTNDPTKRNVPINSSVGTYNDRESVDSVEQINSAKIDIANQYGIPLINTNEMMKEWIQNNNDGYTWYDLQTDGLHFNDVGHRFKAQVFLSYIYNNLVLFNDGVKHVESWDSTSNLTIDYSDVFNGTSSRQGAFVDIDSGVSSESDLMTLRIFNENPNAYIVYRGVGSEGYDDDTSYTIEPSISIYDYMSESESDFNIPSTGRNAGTGVLKQADSYYILEKLSYGLNKIRYVSGDSGGATIGFFSIFESQQNIPSNALSLSGKQVYTFTQGNGDQAYTCSENKDLSNVISYINDDSIEIMMDVDCPQNTGVIIATTKSYGNNDAKTYDRKVYTAIYRGDNDRYELRCGVLGDDGVINSLTQAYSANNMWTSDNQTLCYTQEKETDGSVTHVIYDSYDKSNQVLSFSQAVSANYMINYSGVFGGAISETDSILSDAIVKINEAIILR